LIGKESGSSVTEPAFLLDSNICIYVLRDAQCIPAIKLQQQRVGTVVTSAIVYAEVMRGLTQASSEETEKARLLFRTVGLMAFDEAAAQAYTRVPFKRGRFDRLIAAHALATGLTIVTSNVADFSDVVGLKVEDWTE
jgi:tRNA(fMet)-specific endonuclease VapC